MKKIITLMSAAFMALIISCGPSAEEKAQMEQQRLDSINAVIEQQRQDSIGFAERALQDSIAAVQKAVQDSLNMKAVEDSLAAVKKGMKPKKPKGPVKPQDVKAGQGKG